MGCERIKNAVIFSSYVPDSKIDIGLFYLNCLKENFSDCDIYVGVNSTDKMWLDALEKSKQSGLNLTYEVVSDYMRKDSDASAYQLALSLCKNSKIKYISVLFLHTKGITSGNFNGEGIKKIFLTKERQWQVAESFRNPEIGLWSDYCSKTTDLHDIESLDRFYDFHHTGNKLFIADSIYYMKGHIVYDFIQNCHPDFFDKKITTMAHKDKLFDRYFFERDFPTLCFRMGYLFLFDHLQPHPNYFNSSELSKILEDWRYRNNK